VRNLLIPILLACAAPAGAADAPDARARDLRYRLESLNDRASFAGGIYLDVSSRAARPLPPDQLARLQEVVDYRRADANLPASRPEYVAYTEGLSHLAAEFASLASEFAAIGATVESAHCRRWAQVFAERTSTLRRTIAATDAEERRIAERLEEDPRHYPVRDVGEETNVILRDRCAVEELRRRDRLARVIQTLLSKSAVPFCVVVAVLLFVRNRTRVVTKADIERARREAELERAAALEERVWRSIRRSFPRS
jgi:hypothetical protein